MRGKKLGRLLGVVAAAALAVGATSPAAFAGGAHSQKTPPNVPGFNGSTIKLGVITPQSGIASVVGKPLTEGNRVYWEARNAKGGVAGKYKVDLSVEDSQYDVATALQGYDSIKGDVAAFQQILGTQIVKSVNQRLKADNLYGGPASLEGVWVKQPSLMPFGTPYQVLAANGLDWYQKNGGQGKKVCAMAQDDAYGASGLDGLTQAAKTLNVKVAKTVRFATGSDTSAQVGELADAKCDAVMLVSLPNDTGSIVTKMVGRNFTPTVLGIAPSWLGGLENTDNGPFYQDHYVWLGYGAAWGDTSVQGMAQMLTDQQQYAPDQKPDQYFQFGYGQAWAMDQVLEQAAKNGDFSKAGIKKASNQVGTLKFEGLAGDYKYGKSASDRNPPRDSTIAKIAVGQPQGLQIVATNYTSKAGNTVKFTK
ncbi:MAG TPA: ABC transporter substrate-binding protein [Acidimicrobiia bacterium]|nr:ABC transporter substrate-binding protein [Acidimicrobiia bacterium]